MKKNIMIAAPLAAALLLSPSISHASENAPQAPQVKQLKDSDAMNPAKEKKQLEKIAGKNKDQIKLEPGQPLELNFEDGSKIVYSVEVTEDAEAAAAAAPKTAQATASINEISGPQYASISYKTYKLSKQYFYGVANAIVYLYNDVSFEGRTVYIRRAYAGFTGTFASNDDQNIRYIDRYGGQNDFATSEVNGEFTLYAILGVANYYTRSYVLRADIDPAGGAYLRIIK